MCKTESKTDGARQVFECVGCPEAQAKVVLANVPCSSKDSSVAQANGHSLQRASFVRAPDIILCKWCGAYTTTRRELLSGRCQPGKKSGADSLKRLQRGLHLSRHLKASLVGRPVDLGGAMPPERLAERVADKPRTSVRPLD